VFENYLNSPSDGLTINLSLELTTDPTNWRLDLVVFAGWLSGSVGHTLSEFVFIGDVPFLRLPLGYEACMEAEM
jgi:hypothetical protein